MLVPNTILQSRYRIIRLLGQGGMGAVYEAIDQRVSCVVALKETLVGSDPEARRAFEREAALLANLRHHALPNVMDYFGEGQGEFLVMQFIPGYDLAELLELRGGPFPQDQVLRWCDQLLSVLEYLHSHNPPILHRDIKPANLKVTRRGEIFLLDFGLAKGAAGQMATLKTNESVHGFTRGFASPEQILGQGTDQRSDLYSLGATLYHLLTNTVPSDAPTRSAAREEGEDDPLGSIESLNTQVSPRITAVIHQAMSLNRRQRPMSAAEMQQALRLAAEQDERWAAAEEFRRVEIRQQQQEEVRRKVEVQAAETRRREEEARHQREALEQQQQHEETLRREEEERRQRAQEGERKRAKVPETIPAPRSSTVNSQESSSVTPVEDRPFQVAIETSTYPAPHAQFHEESVVPHSLESPTVGLRVLTLVRNRPVVLASAIVAIMAAGFLILLKLYGLANQNPPVNNQNRSDNKTAQSKTAQSSPPEGMVYVPGGTFTMGRNKSDGGDAYESPAHEVSVKPFFIDIYEVTNDDYAKFIRATNRIPPSPWGGVYPMDAARFPVTGVTWNDANDYALWARKRLPTEEEWEFAARGTDGRRYPWGNDWQNGMANVDGERLGIANVGAYKGKSPFGSFDMVGNAWEWTASAIRAYPGGRLPSDLQTRDLKVIRGGSYQSRKENATTSYRGSWRPRSADTYDQVGFRCVKDVAQ